MARKKSNGANKSELIRQAMDAGIVSPRDIAAYLKDQHGVEATPAYVSTIKSNMKRKGGSGSSKTKGPRVRKAATAMSESGLTSGIEFVRAVGGIDNARKTLDLLEAIKQM
jgi:hypothetical protein